MQSDACVAFFLARGSVLLGLRRKDLWRQVNEVWTAPGGKCFPQETLEGCLRREVLEETGITQFRVVRLLGEVQDNIPGSRVHLYLCATLENARLMEPAKFIKWSWHPLSDLPTNFINPHALPVLRRLATGPGGRNHVVRESASP
jgi:8-oxo-dGTP pyrophosphatase MutT (NUDIX family)